MRSERFRPLLPSTLALVLLVSPAGVMAAECAPDAAAADASGANCIGPVTFTCPGADPESLTATFFTDEEARVEVIHGRNVYPAAIAQSGSGARYVGDGGFVFWNKGDGATVTLPGGETLTCTAE